MKCLAAMFSPWTCNFKFQVFKITNYFSFFPPIFFYQVNVRVVTMDAELEFAIQPNTTGKQLFDQVSYIIVCSRVGGGL